MPFDSIVFIPPTMAGTDDVNDGSILCDECAAGSERTPGLIKTEGTCYTCKAVGLVSKTTYIAPSRRARNGESVSTTPLQAALASATRPPERVARCPHCEAEIESLLYNMPCSEYGSCDLRGENFDSDGTDDSGDVTYICPECNDELDPGDIVYTDVLDEFEDVELPKADCAAKE